MIPLLFMGEECAAREPFLYFTDHQGELADAVREGRRKEFGEFGRFGEGATLASLPDPNAVETLEVLFLDNLACAEYRRGRLSPRSIAVSLEPAHE